MPAPLPAALVDRGAGGCFARVGREPVAYLITDDLMAYDGGKRLLLYALVKGLGDAVRRNDQSAAKRYRRRLRLATEQIAADDPVQDALKKLLLISGRWVVAPVVTLSPKGEGSERYLYRSDRDEPKQQMLDLIERVIGLLPS